MVFVKVLILGQSYAFFFLGVAQMICVMQLGRYRDTAIGVRLAYWGIWNVLARLGLNG